MFRRKRRDNVLREPEARQTQQRFEQNERAGKEIYAGMAGLKNMPRENLPEAAFVLSMAAKRQSEQIRQSIKDRTRFDFDLDALVDGDLATYLAAHSGQALRDHVTNAPTFLEVVSEQLPDVHFTIPRLDAISLIAAMIREQRLEGLLEGLRLAGLLNEAPKRRRTSPQTDGMG